MTKPAYMVIRIDVHDPAAMAPYAAGTMPLLEQHDAARSSRAPVQAEDPRLQRAVPVQRGDVASKDIPPLTSANRSPRKTHARMRRPANRRMQATVK